MKSIDKSASFGRRWNENGRNGQNGRNGFQCLRIPIDLKRMKEKTRSVSSGCLESLLRPPKNRQRQECRKCRPTFGTVGQVWRRRAAPAMIEVKVALTFQLLLAFHRQLRWSGSDHPIQAMTHGALRCRSRRRRRRLLRFRRWLSRTFATFPAASRTAPTLRNAHEMVRYWWTTSSTARCCHKKRKKNYDVNVNRFILHPIFIIGHQNSSKIIKNHQ